jgi:predicted Zn finger-like uncharacterized protein
MPFTTQCPHCSASFGVADQLEGRAARCKKCGKRFTIAREGSGAAKAGASTDHASRNPVDSSIAPADDSPGGLGFAVDWDKIEQTSEPLKACPYCAEMINARASKCKHCGESLQGRLAQTAPAPIRPARVTGNADETLGFWMLCLPLAALVPWLIRVLLREPDPSLLVALGSLEVLLFIAAGVLVFIEARRLGMGSDVNRVWGIRPGFWLFGYIVLWPIFYPLYLYKRSAYGVRNLGLPGLAVVSVFLVLGVVRYTYHAPERLASAPKTVHSRFDSGASQTSEPVPAAQPGGGQPIPDSTSPPPLPAEEPVPTSDTVSGDLLDYHNNHISTWFTEAAALEKKVDSVANKGDEVVHAALMRVIPPYQAMVTRLESIAPKTEEVRTLHEMLIKAANLQHSYYLLLAAAIEQQDAAQVASATEKAAEARSEFRKWSNERDKLCAEHGLVLKNDAPPQRAPVGVPRRVRNR